MGYIAHQIRPDGLDSKISTKLKYICQDWTKIDDDVYIAHHSEALKKSCPICTPPEKKK